MSTKRTLSGQIKRLVSMFLISCLLVALFSITAPISYATDVGGIIDTDTTWTLFGSPYIVTSPVLLLEDVTLTIQPGVLVRFNSHMALQIRGELIAQGTSNQPITFTSNISPASPGDWDYIFFTDSSEDAIYDLDGNYISGSILQYVVIEYAGGSTVTSNAALRLDRSAPFINHATVRYSAADGIRYFGEGSNDLKITHCAISENAAYGISVPSNAGYTLVSNCQIENNDAQGAQLGNNYSHGTYVATDNIVRNNQGAGITVNAQGTVEFRNNLITGHVSCWWGDPSVYLEAHHADISRNLIVDNQGCGGMSVNSYYYYGGLERSILNNIISDNGGISLRVSNAWGSGVTVMHNAILRNKTTEEATIQITNLNGSSDNIRYNTILGNTKTSPTNSRTVLLEWGTPQFTYNNIYDNNGYALWNGNSQGTPDVDARYNWWGTIGSAQISTLIYDWFDDSSLGIVNFSPYQTAHNLDAPISPPSGFSLAPTPSSFVLNWAANPESDLAGYKVYYDTDRGYPYTGTGADQGDSPIDVGNVLDFTLTGLEPGVRYYFAVTSYDVDSDGLEDQTDGNESWFSLTKSGGMGQMPVAGFSGAPTSGPAPLQVAFTNQSTGDFTACLWDFGDGNTSFDCNDPIHSYASAGLYTIQLTVVGLPGESSLTRPDYINVTPGAPASCDFNGDGLVDVGDIIIIAGMWDQPAAPPYDQDGDGWITIADIQRVARWFGWLVP